MSVGDVGVGGGDFGSGLGFFINMLVDYAFREENSLVVFERLVAFEFAQVMLNVGYGFFHLLNLSFHRHLI